MTRNIPRLFVLGASLFPATLFALGLGEIHLNSALSQPFDAEIELVSPTAEELATLKVAMASHESFTRSGLDRPNYLSNFQFRVVSLGNGRAAIRITSPRAVTEPVVSLLVEASWGNGRIQREYTVFLDPPVFVPVQPEIPTQQQPAVVPPPTEESRTQGVIERPVDPVPVPETPVEVPPPVSTTPAPTAEASPPTPIPEPTPPTAETTPVTETVPEPSTPATLGESYEVQRNDSLWKIASRLRSGSPQAINQTMIALYRANPAAFVGNINRLRAGAVLRVPPAEEIEALDAREATTEVSRQYSEWRPEAPAFEEPGRLQLVTPSEPSADVVAAQAAEQARQAEAERTRVAEETRQATERAAAAKQAEEAEAKRLLDLKNAELARMQREREEKAAADAAAAKAAQEAATQPTQTPVEPPAEPVVAQTPETAPAPETTAETPPQTAPEPAEGPSFMDGLKDLPWTMIAGGLGVILVLVGVVVYSRRRQPQSNTLHFPGPDAIVPTMTPGDFDAAMSAEPTRTRSRAQTPAFDFDDAPALPHSVPEAEGTKPLHEEGLRDEYSAPATIARTPPRSADETMSSETAIHVADSQDAVAEADFHMAYGLYDQAADLVKIALGREPKRRDLRLKLLEIYFVWGNKELFLETARELNTTRGQAPQGEWDKILIMGKQIAPEDPLFRGGSVAASSDMLDVNLEGGENRVDFDLFSTPDAGESEAGASLDFEIGNTGARAKPSSHLDFLLDDSGSAQTADDDTREMDANARTQETPTIESPILDRSGPTTKERIPDLNFGDQTSEQTAELSIDDLGLDVSSLEGTGNLERTTALSGSRTEELLSPKEEIGDDEMTRIAPSGFLPPKGKSASLEPTMEMPQISMEGRGKKAANGHDTSDKEDGEDSGISTIYLEQMEASSGDVIETMGPRSDETAHMLGPEDLDLDLAQLGETDASDSDTIRGKAARVTGNEPTAEMPALRGDLAATAEQPRPKMDRSDMLVATSELPEMEPVTMSEVGTKLDLARAYMDMGDPDGARSILEEVLGEGNSGQRAEAQRLLDSVR